MHNEHIHTMIKNPYEHYLFVWFALLLLVYFFATFSSSRRFKRWSVYRTIFWILGVLCMAAAVIGPIAKHAHTDFTAHMLVHVLLGMLAPLLLVLSAPMTLFLRTVNVRIGRHFSVVLKSFPVRFLSEPFVASAINMGGLWILYTTHLYSLMHQNIILYLFIHLHVFIAGYLFTVSMISIDPTPHRTPFMYRAIVLVIALASHGILSKYIYVNPPLDVPEKQAEMGAMLMYYGGDVIDIFFIFIFCSQWYRSKKSKSKIMKTVST
ncbi:cytochrome c oxidase assembly protein [Neobacillus sp. MM2021_6]|uniref:cytochrome c oxidase assembly protein n=1 Tax=Bacillaceae TaxID=186817 RepID=UPI001407D245|nr:MULTISPECIES: cytochrome c oxidase assembly protein [Bacillaceae]MBO0959651.1 cytochrome c oxidase assembly protein [Neobacillus sp. MM2021_6]NHC19760.1 cytochrome c oxidase assembly protein [Bacillus sp. MM2020_4]